MTIGQDTIVELYLDEVWTDISDYVRADPGVTIQFGVRNEAGTADPATCTLVVNNADGRFTPKNAEGPWYGLLKRGLPLRVTVDTVVRFVGEVSEYPSRWEPSGNDVWVPLTASGPLRRIVRGRLPGSALTTGVQSLAAKPTSTITGYWPAEDGDGSTSIASALPGGTPLTVQFGAPVPANSDPGGGTGPFATWNLAAAGGHPVSADPAATGFTLGFYLYVPEGGTADEAELVRVAVAGTATLWTVSYNSDSGGQLRLRVFGQEGQTLHNTSYGFDGMDGIPRYVKIEAVNDGANVDVSFSTLPGPGQYTPTINSVQVGAPTAVQVGAGGNITGDVGIGHIVTGDTNTALFVFGFDDALRGYTNESVEDRMTRIAGLIDVDITILDPGDTTRLGVQPITDPLSIMRDAEAADAGGILRDSLNTINALVYATRTWRYNGEPIIELDYTAGHLAPPLEPIDDDQLLANDVTVTREGGSAAREVDVTGPLNALPWPDGIGTYEQSLTLNVATDGQLPDLASWLLALGTRDETRFPTITVDLTRNTALTADVDLIRPGNYITVTNLPDWADPDTVHLHVLGWTEQITSHRRLFTFNCTPAGPYNVGTYTDTGTFPESRWDTAGCNTAEALDTTETGIDVTTTTGPVWTQDAGMYPFDLMIGGERVTATAISGSGNSQTFTVTRSVNGVVKTHTSGTAVTLADPVYYGL